MNNLNATFRRNASAAVNAIKAGSKKIGAAVAVTAITAQGALAQTGFDEADVTDAISANQAKAIIVVGAFIVAGWVIKSMGLLKRG